MKRNPTTAAVTVLVLSMQFALAALLPRYSWIAVVMAAYFVGSFLSHGLWVLIHEYSHGLVFRRTRANRAMMIFANLALVVPSAIAFARNHLRHHAYLGEIEKDLDLPSEWEASLVGNSPVRKMVWILFCPLFQLCRHFRTPENRTIDHWLILNTVAVLIGDYFIALAFGIKGLAYLLLSNYFGLGPHPLGARFLQEHLVTKSPQETYSYYGMLNFLTFNVGYHNEHHDFPTVAWNRLPKLTRNCSEFYLGLRAYTSWLGLLFLFVSDRTISLRSRMVRTGRP